MVAAHARFWPILLLLAASSSLTPWAQRPSEAGELEAIREATETIEGEIKLASRPQIYLVLDLNERVLLIKGRGIELHRLPIHDWSLSRWAGEGSVRGLFRLQARPQVERPKVEPGKDPTLEPIDLEDMPWEYDLVFDPPLAILVSPPLREQPWLWGRSRWREWRTRFASWLGFAPAEERQVPLLRLTLSAEAARSLAWSAADGMQLLIGRTTAP